ncbi:MAG TPA: hypothetical protein VIC58_05445 [Actinomycetota bacterium]
MIVFLLVLLLIAAMTGVLGAVLQVTLVIVLSLVLSVVVLAWIGTWYAKRRMRSYQHEFAARMDEARRRREAYDVRSDRPAPPAGALGDGRPSR